MDVNLTFEDFLKLHSNIDEKFINDFFRFFNDENQNSKDFIIDLDILAEWLQITKFDKFVKTATKGRNVYRL